MSVGQLNGWDRLRHGGLLIDAPRLAKIAQHAPGPLSNYHEHELRRNGAALLDGSGDVPDFVTFVMVHICGFSESSGTWLRGNNVQSEWGRVAVTKDTVKPRQLWLGHKGGVLPIFLETEKRIGVGRGRKVTSQILQWLRAGNERLALVTNGRQWRLIFAGLDFDAWCEWDLDLWFEEGRLSPQIDALRSLLSPTLWEPQASDTPSILLQAILDSRKGQAELSAVLGERVREAVELLVQGHGEVLKERCADVDPADIYRAAARVVMRMVVVLFAESRELLPGDNAVYHGSYGLGGLLEELERIAARGGNRLGRSWSAWPRILSLFRLVHDGSYHPDLLVPAYGGDLFAPGKSDDVDGLRRALHVFENACFEPELLPDRDVHRILDRITRTRIKLRQGRVSTWVPTPVDFSDLSSEYIGILYEGLLDFELKTAPSGDPTVFLAVGKQPALPLSRLEQMDDAALRNLLEKMKDISSDDEDDKEAEEGVEEDTTSDAAELPADTDATDESEIPEHDVDESPDDERQAVRERAESWARRAVAIANLAPRPRGAMTPERRLHYEESVARKARQLVTRVILPGEWYLVRWGGTRKGSGTFYTRPGLAVPTVHRTLRPLAFDPPLGVDGQPNPDAPHREWIPKKPEEILALKVCDPACGSGSFPVAALRFLTDALYAGLHHHQRITIDGDRAIVRLLTIARATGGAAEERLGEELLPCRPDDDLFEPRVKAVLRRYVVERCIYCVDLDPLAVELCRLALWIETMDRTLPFSFLDHKIKCGNSLVGAWFDQFQHYPVMAWKNREGGDSGHTNGVYYENEKQTKAIKEFSKGLSADLADGLLGQLKLYAPQTGSIETVHANALATLTRLHDLPVQDSSERAQLYRDEFQGAAAYRSLKSAMDLWCACWFWPADELEHAPTPSTFARASDKTLTVVESIAARNRFFHWELEFPDVFVAKDSGFDAILGNPPWETMQPSSKEFFSNIDPLYRSYGKQEALRFQTDYFQEKNTERAWLEYTASFADFSNWMKYAAVPFGDPSDEGTSAERFAISRGSKNVALHTLWRGLRGKSVGYTSAGHPYRYRGEGKAYTYKLFLEHAYSLLRLGGRLGFLVPSGLYSDHGTRDLRTLLLDHCRWEWLFGFENRDKVFEIDSRFKFNPVIIEKGGRTVSIRTAFMRRKLEDWERAEELATHYKREQIERFSPNSKAILEIQSQRDLEILEKIYANSVLLGDDGPDGWGIKYAQGDFNMTSDSKLFPPRPKWEAGGYRPDEYSRWLKGNWRPIAELWAELGVKILPEGERRCAQPPYDAIPIPRADIPAGIILSRDCTVFIREDGIGRESETVIEENGTSREVEFPTIALPLYEGRMIGQFDFSQKGWVSGKGRAAVWKSRPESDFAIRPQYLMSQANYAMALADSASNRIPPELAYRCFTTSWHRMSLVDVTSSTNSRTVHSAILPLMPHGHSATLLQTESAAPLSAIANSFIFDWLTRLRLSGLHLVWSILEELPLPVYDDCTLGLIDASVAALSFVSPSTAVLSMRHGLGSSSCPVFPAVSPHERLRRMVCLDVAVAALLGLTPEEFGWLLRDCDLPSSQVKDRNITKEIDPKGFWRIGRVISETHGDARQRASREWVAPELRQTVLTLVAYQDFVQRHKLVGGSISEELLTFLGAENGDGWVIPEAIRLADYNLGRDDRAKEYQPVASRLGPRFYDWQLAQTAEESGRECKLHARNLLGEVGYKQLLDEQEREKNGDKHTSNVPPMSEIPGNRDKDQQQRLL